MSENTGEMEAMTQTNKHAKVHESVQNFESDTFTNMTEQHMTEHLSNKKRITSDELLSEVVTPKQNKD